MRVKLNFSVQIYEKKARKPVFSLKNQAKTTALSFNEGIFCCCKQHRRNQQRKQKTRKRAGDMKKPQNAGVLTKTAKRNALWFFSDSLSKLKCRNYVFRCFRQNGTFFREMAFAAMFFRFFCVFRCLMMRCHAAFYWYATCYIHLTGKFESEVPNNTPLILM